MRTGAFATPASNPARAIRSNTRTVKNINNINNINDNNINITVADADEGSGVVKYIRREGELFRGRPIYDLETGLVGSGRP